MSTSTQETNKEFEDPIIRRAILIDNCTRYGVTTFPEMKERYDAGYLAYKTNPKVLDSLKSLSAYKKITIVLGTWCGDSKLQVPHFFKIVDALGINEEDLTLIGVDSSKKAENGLLDKLSIERVPTFIFYEEDQEIGRIVESPATTLEEDILAILKK